MDSTGQSAPIHGETTKRGPQVHGLPSWTWSMDYTRGPRTTPVDHSRGPLAKFRLPNNRLSTINPSLGSRDWRELFVIHFHYLLHNQFSFC